MFVAGDHDRVAPSLRDRHGDQLAVEPAGQDRGRDPPLAFPGERVLTFARDRPVVSHALCRLAQAHHRVARIELRVDEAPAERRVHQLVGPTLEGALRLEHHVGRAAHRLHAAGDEDVAVADRDRVRCGADRLHARATEPVDGQPGDLHRQPGDQQRHTGHVAVVLAGLVRAAQDHVLDTGRVHTRPVHERPDDERGQVVRADGGERPPVASDRRADRIDDPGVTQQAAEVSGHARILGRRRGQGGAKIGSPARTF